MFRYIGLIFLLGLFIALNSCKNGKENPDNTTSEQLESVKIQYFTDYVNPLIGTAEEGSTSPAVFLPFGMVQLGPDTEGKGESLTSGYHFQDSLIRGFSHTHLSGSRSDLQEVSFLPFLGSDIPQAQAFYHGSEVSRAGYYAVTLLDGPIKAELTTSSHVGAMRFTFPKSDSSMVVLDLAKSSEGESITASGISIQGDSLLLGYQYSNRGKEKVYYATSFSKSPQSIQLLKGTDPLDSSLVRGRDVKALIRFASKENDQITIKTGISRVSAANALDNLNTAEGISFFDMVDNSRADWESVLGKIVVDTHDTEMLEEFYTALYRVIGQVVLKSDANGQYRSGNDQIKKSLQPVYQGPVGPKGNRASTVLALLYPQKAEEMIGSFSEAEGGWRAILSGLASSGRALSFSLSDSSKKAELASQIEQKISSLYQNRKDGYLPFRVMNSTVSRDLFLSEEAVSLAQLYEAVGNKLKQVEWEREAENYKLHFDSAEYAYLPIDQWGNTVSYLKTGMGSEHYLNGSKTDYQWYFNWNQDEIEGLKGARSEHLSKLIEFLLRFNQNTSEGDQIGEAYKHETVYMHNYVLIPALAGRITDFDRVLDLITETYHPRPEGLVGPDEGAALSAWFILRALGIQPITAASNRILIHPSLFKSYEIKKGEGLNLRVSKSPDIARDQIKHKDSLISPIIFRKELPTEGIIFTSEN